MLSTYEFVANEIRIEDMLGGLTCSIVCSSCAKDKQEKIGHVDETGYRGLLTCDALTYTMHLPHAFVNE